MTDFSSEILYRILRILYIEKNQSPSVVAMKALMNYQTSTKYFKHMKSEGWIEDSKFDSSKLNLTVKGEEHLTSLDQFKKDEILNVFKMIEDNEKRNERMKEILSKEWNAFSLLALSGFSYLHEMGFNWKNGIEKHLESGKKMKVLLSHQDGQEAQIRRKLENRSDNAKFMKVPLSRLRELKKDYKNLEIRLTKLPIYCSLFLWDEGCIYDPYHLGNLPDSKDGQNRFIVIEMVKNNYYTLLQNHFNFIWNQEKDTMDLKKNKK